ncbi:MAG TPA: transglycosylase domain-containing protein [Rubrobacter sp.]|nr:transglycosylase domain-containing protein [Rubrobacter sp.]
MDNFFETSKKTSKGRPLGRFMRRLRALFNLVLILGVSAVIFVACLYLFVIKEYENSLNRTYPELAENSYVYDVDGQKIGEFPVTESRETVGFEGLGEHLPEAVVAVEDRRFYDHFGVDFEGLARAAWTDLRSWEVQEGGSTITEQLMKNLYVPEDQRFETSFRRRFVQSALAFAYERKHTKNEVLTAYLNTVYFGDGAYGAEAASQRYFDKSARDLNLSEAATLAGLLHAPSTYTTWEGDVIVERARDRRDRVLRLMQEQGMISSGERDAAESTPLKFAPDPPPDDPAYTPFLEKVRREVGERLGPRALELGGLRIHTTMEPAFQHAAVETSDNVLSEPDDPSAAVVTVEPQSGAIRALAGQEGDFNLSLDARRQPGSSFKPIVLAAALREDISPYSTYVSHELTFDFNNEYYEVHNYDYIERGAITVSKAMAESDNTVFVQLAADVGLDNVVQTAKDLGIKSPVEPYPSTAIGGLGTGVSPLEMASAYSTFAGGGIHREPYSIESIDRNSYGESETVYDHEIGGRRVLTGNQAAVATQVLRGVVEEGTATMFHDLDEEIGHPSAGKTGTTDNFADAWYVGYTPRLCTSVWVGYPEGRHSLVGVHGIEEPNGETLPMDIWSEYMARATEGDLALDFPEADTSDLEVLTGGPTSGF